MKGMNVPKKIWFIWSKFDVKEYFEVCVPELLKVAYKGVDIRDQVMYEMMKVHIWDFSRESIVAEYRDFMLEFWPTDTKFSDSVIEQTPGRMYSRWKKAGLLEGNLGHNPNLCDEEVYPSRYYLG